MSSWKSVAYVESPLQFLSVVEAQHKGCLGTSTEIIVRDPVQNIAPSVGALRDLGLPQGIKVHEIGLVRPSGASRPIRGDYQHVLGDPFSGQQQSGLVRRSRVKDIVIVDDGLNTFAAVEALAGNKPMIRPGHSLSPARRALANATTHVLRKAAFAGRLTVFTAMPPSPRFLQQLEVIDAKVTFHSFEWLASRADAPAIEQQRIIVGSGFVADRLVQPSRYLQWVAETAALTPTLYFPHRRSEESLISAVEEVPLVTVAGNSALVELQLRSLGSTHSVHLLPTTALITLAPLVKAAGSQLHPVPVPDEWWLPDVSPSHREFLSRPLKIFESL